MLSYKFKDTSHFVLAFFLYSLFKMRQHKDLKIFNELHRDLTVNRDICITSQSLIQLFIGNINCTSNILFLFTVHTFLLIINESNIQNTSNTIF